MKEKNLQPRLLYPARISFKYEGEITLQTSEIWETFEKTLMLGKIEGRKRRGWQSMRWLDGITDTMDMGLGGLRELEMDRAAVHGVTKSQTRLSNWTELTDQV